ncbi:ABC transporter ATP-binding protein [Candidatus Mycoplasma pogonae]
MSNKKLKDYFFTKKSFAAYQKGDYVEKQTRFGIFTKTFLRRPLKGTSEMLDANPEKEILASLRHVDITYGTGTKAFRAVHDLNLNIYDGEVLGLVGESGSGKSTIGRTIIGLVPYSFGEIKLLDKTLPKKNYRGFKIGKALKEFKQLENFLVNKVQIIFQDPSNSLNPHVNVESIVSEGLENTKNSREIYFYDLDLQILDKVWQVITESNRKNVFTKTYNKTIVQAITENIDLSTQALETNLLPLLKQYNETKALAILKQELQNRSEALKTITEKKAQKILIREMLKNVGLDESVLKRYPLEFSGGQQQRIGISRAVVLRPKLLIADEPISALDVSIQAQVVNIFNDLKEKFQLTILFIAHDLRMVEYISDRIAVMNKGTLLEVGKTEAIMANPVHPYTKSLLDAIPSLDPERKSLIGYVYDINMHHYSEANQPQWIRVKDDHFVLATPDEFSRWSKKNFS